MGLHTLRDGEVGAVFAPNGSVKIVQGPKLIFTAVKTFQRLPYYRANQNQYLSVTFTDGHIENILGPICMYRHPLEHTRVELKDAILLTSHEALVVYRRITPMERLTTSYAADLVMKKGQEEKEMSQLEYHTEIHRQIVRGPCVHVPHSDEWIHQFSWHGEDDKKAHIVPNAKKFQKLKLVADQFYYNIKDVRTADDALIQVKVMIFFEIEDVDIMLDNTQDPIADFTNSACADVVAFVAAHSYSEFVDSTCSLNEISTYPQLTSRAERIGCKISKVVYRGYHAYDALQKMHDTAIQTRTQLRLRADTERQNQEIEDMVIQKNARRAELQFRLEEEEMRHKNKMMALKTEEEVKRDKSKSQAKVEEICARNMENQRYLDHLHSLGVDLTQYLTAEYNKADKVIRFDRGNNGARRETTSPTDFHPNVKLHFHE